MHRKEFFKIFRAPSLADSLAKRCETAKNERLEKQKNLFWQKRIQVESPLPKEPTLPAKPKNTSRGEMLKIWKAEKLKKLEEEKKNKKPIFKVGIVHRKATGSPILKPDFVGKPKKCEKKDLDREQGVVTRSRAKNMLIAKENIKAKNNGFCKVQNGKMKTISKYEFKVPESVAELQSKIENFTFNNSICEKSVMQEPIEVEVKEKENIQTEKRSLRKRSVVEAEQKILEQTLPFRKYIEDETKRLLDTAEKWKHIYEEFEEVPPEVEGDIDSVVGKTKLLTSDKFMQFQELIIKCEKEDPLIKIDDLKGFQDWVSIEVDRINEEFDKLEKKKLNNWTLQPDPVVVNKKAVVKKTAKRPVGKSNIAAHIQAARKRIKNENVSETLNIFVDEKPIKENTPRKPVLKDILNVTANLSTPSKLSPVPERKSARLANSGKKRVTIADSTITTPKYQPLSDKRGRSIRKTPMPRIVTPNDKENSIRRGGLDEKYFRPVEDEESSPSLFAF